MDLQGQIYIYTYISSIIQLYGSLANYPPTFDVQSTPNPKLDRSSTYQTKHLEVSPFFHKSYVEMRDFFVWLHPKIIPKFLTRRWHMSGWRLQMHQGLDRAQLFGAHGRGGLDLQTTGATGCHGGVGQTRHSLMMS